MIFLTWWYWSHLQSAIRLLLPTSYCCSVVSDQWHWFQTFLQLLMLFYAEKICFQMLQEKCSILHPCRMLSSLPICYRFANSLIRHCLLPVILLVFSVFLLWIFVHSSPLLTASAFPLPTSSFCLLLSLQSFTEVMFDFHLQQHGRKSAGSECCYSEAMTKASLGI